MATKLAGR